MTPLNILIALIALGAGTAVHLAAAGRLRRNGILGIRTASTRRDDTTWVRGHRAAVVPTWLTSCIVVGLSAASITWEGAAVVLTSIAVVLLLAGAFIGTVLANRAARSGSRP
ncbi:SdpI family protein [Leifsonia sp. L25]|uniref:SdpI family protein n=1 Tax=Actinomycetes TaxID=1760 RepID=UPI003D69BE14